MNFSNSLLIFLRLLGLPLGLPLEVILLDWTKSNYSQSRAVLEQAYQTFLGWQQLLRQYFLDPVLRWKLAEWQIALPADAWWEWNAPTFPWLDQLKEAQAQAKKLSCTMTTLDAVCKGLRSDRRAIVKQRSIEIREAIKEAQKITKETGETVDWRLFAGVEVPAGTLAGGQSSDSPTMGAGQGPTDNPTDGGPADGGSGEEGNTDE